MPGDAPLPRLGAGPGTAHPVTPELDRPCRLTIGTKGEIHHPVRGAVDMAHRRRGLRAGLRLAQGAGNGEKRRHPVTVLAGIAPGHRRAVGIARDIDPAAVDGIAFRGILDHGGGKGDVVGLIAPEIPGLAPSVGRQQQHTAPPRRPGNPAMLDDQSALPHPAVKMQQHRQGRGAIPIVGCLDVIGPLPQRAGNVRVTGGLIGGPRECRRGPQEGQKKRDQAHGGSGRVTSRPR